MGAESAGERSVEGIRGSAMAELGSLWRVVCASLCASRNDSLAVESGLVRVEQRMGRGRGAGWERTVHRSPPCLLERTDTGTETSREASNVTLQPPFAVVSDLASSSTAGVSSLTAVPGALGCAIPVVRVSLTSPVGETALPARVPPLLSPSVHPSTLGLRCLPLPADLAPKQMSSNMNESRPICTACAKDAKSRCGGCKLPFCSTDCQKLVRRLSDPQRLSPLTEIARLDLVDAQSAVQGGSLHLPPRCLDRS